MTIDFKVGKSITYVELKNVIKKGDCVIMYFVYYDKRWSLYAEILDIQDKHIEIVCNFVKNRETNEMIDPRKFRYTTFLLGEKYIINDKEIMEIIIELDIQRNRDIKINQLINEHN